MSVFVKPLMDFIPVWQCDRNLLKILCSTILNPVYDLKVIDAEGSQSELIVYQWSIVVHTFKLEYLWSQMANLDQILRVASLGWGKGCIRFWGRLDQNSGFNGNRKPPLT